MPANYELFCAVAGFLFFLDWLCYLPLARLFFGPGYGEGRMSRTPFWQIAFALWGAAALCLMVGFHRLEAAVLLAAVMRYYYIATRWTSLYRGGGAPGFMSHYFVAFIALFEIARTLDPFGGLLSRAFALYRLDLGLILLCAGTYKSLVGYLSGDGMEYGTVNPMWGYFHAKLRNWAPGRLFFRFQNVAAVLGEWFIGIALIGSLAYPSLAVWGGAVLILSFLYTAGLIRLGRLAFLMMTGGLLLLPDLGWVPAQAAQAPRLDAPGWMIPAVGAAMTALMILLPIVKAKQYLNLFGNKSLPEPFETMLSRYANFVPIILWRVFTADVTNFFIRIYETDAQGREAVLLDENTAYSYSHRGSLGRKWRFLQVTESIVLTTVFTTLKYFASNRALFDTRLVRYARTLGAKPGSTLRFQYVSIRKGAEAFEYAAACDFLVDPARGTVAERKILESFSYHATARFSPVRESAGYGTYTQKQETA